MKNFNDRLARLITAGVATMWCAYLFTGLALISLPAAIGSHDVVIIVAWIAQTFLQLVLLSIILVGQKLSTEKVDENHAEMKGLHQEHRDILSEIHAKLNS
jgi:hypothetical protein